MEHDPTLLYAGVQTGLKQLGAAPALTHDGCVWPATALHERIDDWAQRLQQRGLAQGRALRWNADDDSVDALCVRLAAWRLNADFVAGDAPPDGDIVAAFRPAARQDAATATLTLRRLDAALRNLTAPPAVLGTLTAGAALAVLAGWRAGRAATHVTLRHGTGTALAALERLAPSCVVLPESLPSALAAHPGAALSDLNAVTLIITVSEGPPNRSAHAPRTLFPSARHVALAASATHAEARLAEHADGALPATLQARVCGRLEQAFQGMAWQQAAEAARELGRTALLSMLHALGRCGLYTQAGASHTVDDVLRHSHCAAAHEALIRRWLRVLAEQQLLEPDGDRLRLRIAPSACSDAAMAQAWDRVAQLWAAIAGGALTIDYARRNAQCLPALIAGRQQAVQLLFPQGNDTVAQALYRESPAARYQHRAMAELARCAADACTASHRVRVLEIGAGTGATTDVVRPRLAGLDIDYLYTDVSPYFVSQAQRRHAGDGTMRYGLYDMDRHPQAQGYAPNAFDLIVCGGALNAARNTDATLRGLRTLLAPGGWLLLSEPTREEFWVMASQAFMLTNASDGRAATQSTFLSREQWHAALDGAGLQCAADLPPDGHPLQEQGHRVFAAHAPDAPGARHDGR